MRPVESLTRRTMLDLAWRGALGGALALGAGLAARADGERRREPTKIRLGFSLYGMKSVPLDEALAECARIGYECLELPVMSDWPTDSARLEATERRRIRELLDRHGLPLVSLMEHLPLLAQGDEADRYLKRLDAAARLAREWAPATPAVIETVLGGRPADWMKVRQEMAERLGAWAEVGRRHEVVIAVKPHVAGAVHRPEDAAWLIETVASPWLQGVFDFSHYQLRGRELAECWQQLASHTVFIHVKDARGDAEKYEFLLPGQGRTDYVAYFRMLAAHGYRGPVVVEVSGQIHGRPGYRPDKAARDCFAALAMAREQAGIARSD